MYTYISIYKKCICIWIFLLQAQSRPWTLFSGTLWGRTCLRWRLKVLSSSSSPYCCNTSSSFASGTFKATLSELLYHISDDHRQLVGCKYFDNMQTELVVGFLKTDSINKCVNSSNRQRGLKTLDR